MKEKCLKNKIEDIMNSAMDRLKPLIDANVVIGNIIEKNELTIIPLSKVTMGYVSGGGEYYSELKEIKKETEYPFSGGSGGGVSIQPVGFLIVKNGIVELLKIDSKSPLEKLIEAVPEIARFAQNAFGGKNKDEEN